MIAFRNKNLREAETIRSRQKQAVEKFSSLLSATASSHGSIEIRHIDYPLDITAVFVDPESANPLYRRGLVRLVGFRNYFSNKRDFVISFTDEPSTYQLFVEQFKEMWDASQPLKIEQ